jgi:hypothetical protein
MPVRFSALSVSRPLPHEYSWYSFLLEAEWTLGPYCGWKEIHLIFISDVGTSIYFSCMLQRHGKCVAVLDFRYSRRWLKSTVFWDMKPCTVIEVCWRFGGTYCLHFQGPTANQASRKQRTLAYMLWFLFRSWRWMQHVPPKALKICIRLYGVTSQEIV